MGDPATLLAVLLGFGLLLVAASRLGAGTTFSLQGLFARPAGRDWPRGVQETDAPRFAVSHLDSLRPGTPVRLDIGPLDDDGPSPEMVELGPGGSDRAI